MRYREVLLFVNVGLMEYFMNVDMYGCFHEVFLWNCSGEVTTLRSVELQEETSLQYT